MTDANLVRVLQPQTRRNVGLIDYSVVACGAEAIARRIAELRRQGVGIAIVDAVSNDDLLRLGRALADMPLVTAALGLAIGLPQNFGLEASSSAAMLPRATGKRAVVSGSCSEATNRQVAHFAAAGRPSLAIDPMHIAAGEDVIGQALAWAAGRLEQGPVLVYSTANTGALKSVQGERGAEAAGAMVERTIAGIARGLVEAGEAQLVVAGGETSGACVQALGIEQLQIGPQIDPEVPWCHAPNGRGLHIALKSGNFCTDDFFIKAFDVLEGISRNPEETK